MKMNDIQKMLLTDLVKLRRDARKRALVYEERKDDIALLSRNRYVAKSAGDAETERVMLERLQESEDRLTKYEPDAIEIGRNFAWLSREINKHVPRELWLEALSVNRSEWDSDKMSKYGLSPLHVVRLQMECSATKEYRLSTFPLAWCCHLALQNARKITGLTGIKTLECVEWPIYEGEK